MSTRQRSFFDQKPNNKPRYPQWRNKPRANDSRETCPSDDKKVTTAPPPIPPSARTMSKLKAFQFIEGRPSERPSNPTIDPDKENEVPATKEFLGKDGEEKSNMTPSKPVQPPVEIALNTGAPPSTPATRLPLADLIGNGETKNSQAPNVASPDDHVFWEHQEPTPASRRGKKRARSSSPLSSQSPVDSAERISFNLEQIQRVLKTPQADPAADLWNRYTTSSQSKEASTAKKTVSFAHLIDEPSPRSSATAGNISGLRRWTSCGLEWPTSNAKRRRTSGRFRAAMGHDVSPLKERQEEAVDTQEGSKAERLLKQIQKSLPKPITPKRSDVPSSSSPLPETAGFRVGPQGSPLQNIKRPAARRIARPMTPEGDSSETLDDGPVIEKSPSSSSDYGGADIDVDMVEAIEATQAAASGATRPSPENPPQQPTVDVHSTPPRPPEEVKEPVKEQNPVVVISDDEFDFGDDDDIFAADLEDVASRYDGVAAEGEANDVFVQNENLSQQPQAAEAPVIALADTSDDEFGGLDEIDDAQFEAAVAHATQACNSGSQSINVGMRQSLDPSCIVDVQESQFTDVRGRCYPEKILCVRNERKKYDFFVILRDSWYDTACTPGCFIHVIGECDENGNYVVDDTEGLLILHPDQLLSATTVSESSECVRRSVLNDRIKMATNKSNALVYGYLLHEMFQEAMKTNQWDDAWLDKCAREILPKHLEDLVEINLSIEEAINHLRSKAPVLRAWAKVFVQPEPGPTSMVEGRNGQKVQLSISKLLDVEENILSPVYGLKGKIDATIQIAMNDETGSKTLTVPFELKTGKDNASHRAQTALYTLLLSDRYDVDIAYGILWNIETGKTTRIQAIRHLIRPLVMRRNELAAWVRQRSVLPEMPNNYMFCDNCKVRDPCFIYHKLTEGGDGTILRPKAKDKFDELIRYLKPNHAEFFLKWQTVLSQEEADMMKFRKELWTMLSTERERLGRAFSNVIIEEGSYRELNEGSKINRYKYSFVKQNSTSNFSFAESQLIVGEPIVISDEQGHYCLARGFVTGIQKRRVTVTVDRALHNARRKKPDFDPDVNQVFAGITELPRNGEIDPHEEPVVYRVDKDEFENGMGIPRNNLIQLMNDTVFKAADLRALIVDNRAPVFKTSSSIPSLPSQAGMSMNLDQKAAIEKVMCAQDYALVLGMPGTGKTTTIAKIIRSLVARGKSVLLTSFQHSAVDNILLKFKKDNIPILRLGAVSKVHPQVREFAILAEQPKESVAEIERSWMDPPIVAATCLKVDHPVFSRRIFDYCIVDEASQITLPTCLGPIRMARTFVLVGDHHQLPPLVRNKDALAGGLDMSLFKILSEQHPEAVVNLEYQYRMAADIMLLSNKLIYSGRLKCGTEAVANQVLSIPNPAAIESIHYPLQPSTPTEAICPGNSPSSCYISRVLEPSTRVLFLNTDSMGYTALEATAGNNGNRITNHFEATVLTHLTTALLATGVPAGEIGLITPFRSQLSLLRSSLRSTIDASSAANIELNTADKYQGRDKACILVSFTRCNESATVGELLKDERRINVAITRAQSKLVIVGSRKTLSQGSELLKGLVDICDERGWIWDLKPGCIEGHRFEEFTTQATLATQVPKSPEAIKGSPVRVKIQQQRLDFKPADGQAQDERKALNPIKPRALNARSGNASVNGNGNGNGKWNSNSNPPFKPPKMQKGSQGMRRPGKVIQAKQSSLAQLFEKGGGVMRDVFNDAI